MKVKPFFSIITVCLNSERTIEKTLKSVLNQTFKDFEYIIVDGCSTDNTMNIVRKYENQFPNGRFFYISEKDNGIYYAMNKGIGMAKGKYVGIINSDDTYEINTLQIVFQSIKKNGEVDVLHGLLRIKDGENLKMIKGRSSMELDYEMIEHPTCFVKRETYSNYGIFDCNYKYVADYDLMLRLKKNNCTFKMIEKILANFDTNGASSTSMSAVEYINYRKLKGISNPFDCLFPFSKIEKGSKIVIYGFGYVGDNYLKQLALSQYCKVAGIVDIRWEKIDGNTVKCPLKIKQMNFDYIVAATQSEKVFDDIKSDVRKIDPMLVKKLIKGYIF